MAQRMLEEGLYKYYPKSKGKVAKLDRVIMERGTYPREWKTK